MVSEPRCIFSNPRAKAQSTPPRTACVARKSAVDPVEHQVYVNDRNSDGAPSYTVANVRAGIEQRARSWTLREFVGVNNLTDRNYVGR